MHKQNGSPAPPEPIQGCDADACQVRREIREQVLRDAAEMVAAAVKKAKRGHYLIMRYLFQLAGLYPQVAEERGNTDSSLAHTLCERLGLPASEAISEADTEAPHPPVSDPEVSGGRSNGHALK